MMIVVPNVFVKMGEEERAYKNNMVTSGLEWALDKLAGLPVGELSHIAVGDDGTQVSFGDLQLKNERARKPITAINRDLGVALAEVFFDKSEALFHWREIGLFAAGTDTANSGILVARAIVTEDKDSFRTATVSWELGLKNA